MYNGPAVQLWPLCLCLWPAGKLWTSRFSTGFLVLFPVSYFIWSNSTAVQRTPFSTGWRKNQPKKPLILVWLSMHNPTCNHVTSLGRGNVGCTFWRSFFQKSFLFPAECNCGGRMCDSQTGECLADSPEVSTGTDCPTISKKIIMKTPKINITLVVRCLQILT